MVQAALSTRLDECPLVSWGVPCCGVHVPQSFQWSCTGGCDFSTRVYTYDEVEGDFGLANFALAPEDLNLRVRVAWN
jgi:hypothetical protein